MFTVSLGAKPIVGWIKAPTAGDGTGVVYLHGWGRSKSDALPLIEKLPPETAVFVPDLPGFGDTDPPSGPWGASEYAESLRDALEEFVTRHELCYTVLVGHSFGGKIALVLGAQGSVPSVVGVVLVGAPILRPGRGPSPSVSYRMWRFLYGLKVVSAERFERVRDSHGSVDYRSASGVMREVFVRVVNEEHPKEMEKIVIPVEMVVGSADTAAPPERALAAAGLNPLAHLTVLEGIGHMIPLTQPQAIVDAVRLVRERASERRQ